MSPHESFAHNHHQLTLMRYLIELADMNKLEKLSLLCTRPSAFDPQIETVPLSALTRTAFYCSPSHQYTSR
jgi:hypothetical protein